MPHYPSSEWTWGIALVVFLIVIIYGVLKTRRRGDATKRLTEEATKEVYREEERRTHNDPTR